MLLFLLEKLAPHPQFPPQSYPTQERKRKRRTAGFKGPSGKTKARIHPSQCYGEWKLGSAEANSVLSAYASQIISISATKEDGLEELKDTIFNSCVKNWKEQKEGIIITNLRHKIAIQAAYDSLGNALKSMETNQPIEITAIDLREALDRLGEIVGAVTTDDILNRIFSDFCIGK